MPLKVELCPRLAKTETIGGCGACGSATGLTKSYFYLHLDQGTVLDQNEVVRLVVEDTQDSAGSPKYRTVYGLNDTGQLLRKAFITSPTGSAQYWCESNKFATTGLKHRIAEERSPSAHTAVVSAANLRSFLDPYDSEGNSWTNDTNTLNASDGLIYVYEHNSVGAATGKRSRDPIISFVATSNEGFPNTIDFLLKQRIDELGANSLAVDESIGFNSYQYAGGNPIERFDSQGLAYESCRELSQKCTS